MSWISAVTLREEEIKEIREAGERRARTHLAEHRRGRPPTPPEIIQQAKDMEAAGRSRSAICKALRIHIHTLERYLGRLPSAWIRRPLPAELIEQARKLEAAGKSRQEISRTLRVNADTLKRYLGKKTYWVRFNPKPKKHAHRS